MSFSKRQRFLNLLSLHNLFFLYILVIPAYSFAAAETNAPDEYYTFDETLATKATQDKSTFQAMALFSEKQFAEISRVVRVYFLRWSHHQEVRPLPEDPYARKLHFGRWINDPFDNTCMNTRARVLVRDSASEVSYRNERNCVVDSGTWNDSYSGNTYSMAKEIQVDHMVPLKNAYLAGAWQWDYKTRCLYANYMGYEHHLVSASSRENTSKGDRGPEKYLPSNENYRCQYIKDWLAIKLIWGLSMTRQEAEAVQSVVQKYNCDTDDFSMSKSELADQRNEISNNLDYCLVNKQ